MAEYINKAKLYNKIAERETRLYEQRNETENKLKRHELNLKLNDVARFKFWVADTEAEDVAPVLRGEWLDSEEGNAATCDWCGEVLDVGECGFENFKKFYHYCPNCGAKMGEEEITSE